MNTLYASIRKDILSCCAFLFFVCCCSISGALYAAESTQTSAHDTPNSGILVLYYSRTEKTAIISETIAKETGATVIRITEPDENRAGFGGFVSAAYDAFLDRHSAISPRKIDLEPYYAVVIATPIWSWNLATPIQTLLRTHYFGKQRLILVTTANIDIKKYDTFKDGSGNAVQNFLQRYLEQKRLKARKEISAATANELEQFRGHFHIETKGKSDEQLRADGSEAAKKILSLLAADFPGLAAVQWNQDDVPSL